MNMSQPRHHHTLATALQGVYGGRRDHLRMKLLSGVLPHVLGLQNVKTARQIMPGLTAAGERVTPGIQQRAAQTSLSD